MAVPSKELSAQSPTTSIKEVPFTCGRNIKDYVHYITGAKLSEALMSTFIPDDTTWTFRPGNELSRISLLGKDWTQMDGNHENAKTILEIIRKYELTKDGNKIFTPTDLSIASIYSGQQTVIAAAWDLENQSQLTEVIVSISGAERIQIGRELGFQSEAFKTRIISVPTNANEPHKTAGLITQGMCKEVNESIRNHYPYPKALPPYPLHDYAMTLKFKHASSDTKRDGQLALDETSALILKKCDYHHEFNNGIFTVCLGVQEESKKILKPRKISIPTFLKKAC